MGGRLQGLFAINCGASQWWADFGWDVNAASPRDRFRLFFNYGSADFLEPYEAQSFDKYGEQLGFEVERTVIPGATHCAHPIAQPDIAFWEKNMR
jgi:hypothetical protein